MRSADLPLMFAFAAHHLGVAYARAGRYTEALALLEQKAGQTGAFQALALVRLGEAYALTGRDVDAASVARQALERARADQQRASEADALHLIATIASHREPPDPDVAAAYYAQALAVAKPRGMRPLVAHCHFGLATLYRRIDQQAEARERLIAATSMYREMAMTYWPERAEAEIGA